MYPSGTWHGFWEQSVYGRQPMTAFKLHFQSGVVSGRGVDVVGPFTFRGTYDEKTGRVRMTKQYVGRHSVEYDGTPDGEGCIGGTWWIGEDWKGAFRLKPELPKPTGDEPILEIT
jgi:hypothetical protein